MTRRRSYTRPARRRGVIKTELRSPNCDECGNIMLVRLRVSPTKVICINCFDKQTKLEEIPNAN